MKYNQKTHKRCQFCGKLFGVKGIPMHQSRCGKNPKNTDEEFPEDTDSIEILDHDDEPKPIRRKAKSTVKDDHTQDEPSIPFEVKFAEWMGWDVVSVDTLNGHILVKIELENY